MSRPLEDYALLSDLETAALVSRDGSADWLCFPRFDSGACFAALLGDEEHGHWRVGPARQYTTLARRYRGHSLILETELETADGAVRLIDFMPPRGRHPDLVRIVEGVRGQVAMRSQLVIRFDYGAVVPWVRRVDGGRVAVAGADAIHFATPAETHGENLRTVSEFSVREGDRVPFVLTWFPSYGDGPAAVDAEQALRDTEDFWDDWSAARTRASGARPSFAPCSSSRGSSISPAAASSRRRRPPCPSGSEACGTATTASAGFVMAP